MGTYVYALFALLGRRWTWRARDLGPCLLNCRWRTPLNSLALIPLVSTFYIYIYIRVASPSKEGFYTQREKDRVGDRIALNVSGGFGLEHTRVGNPVVTVVSHVNIVVTLRRDQQQISPPTQNRGPLALSLEVDRFIPAAIRYFDGGSHKHACIHERCDAPRDIFVPSRPRRTTTTFVALDLSFHSTTPWSVL